MSDSPNPLADEDAYETWTETQPYRFHSLEEIAQNRAAFLAGRASLSTALAAAEAEREGMREALRKIDTRAEAAGGNAYGDIARRALNSEPNEP